ncbi:uncharacterized protein Tco025E_02528 [Trypanosoma conorhini]|uniref:Uncharacterized protein n=1 Tax=Trypanosoma conorhini TaxID=83891 RepID=A0A3S5IU38_9TRYP|nr:uncharacterized protein Tco025E_02528 [Trypanosoma conorhini]RNF24465.1 hypothetical protein Tco025E_02528 [Trypanosoma conorhini]
MTANAVVFAALLLVAVVPPLYIYDPEKHPGESLGPPPAGSIFPDRAPNFAVQQKLYMLFTLPVCALLNSLFVYFTYYRHYRQIQFRAELSCVAHANLRTAIMVFSEEQQINEYNGVNIIGGTRSGGGLSNHSLLAVRFNANKTGPHYMCLDNRRHIRPEGLSLQRYSSTPWFPELQELQRVVEVQFLRLAETARSAAFRCFCQTVLLPFEERMKLKAGSMANDIRLFLRRQSKWVPEPMMRVHLTRIELERRRKDVHENNLESEPVRLYP